MKTSVCYRCYIALALSPVTLMADIEGRLHSQRTRILHIHCLKWTSIDCPLPIATRHKASRKYRTAKVPENATHIDGRLCRRTHAVLASNSHRTAHWKIL